ncbi:DUF4344 domain-containing metallopeptidase [Jannaschia donghaensis]|uniref:Metallopeptidase n=1 Tax=Jannaschia donghaensis TaxID=420998 RepID=A0A0M6YI26_9RHOB|nr:DUF4344 domain-containing metallopeptidase [Jannaschia donghaensis]CTQ49600.1 hypothetical protein JDO7802_01614 [Jannaschia donghaensis]
MIRPRALSLVGSVLLAWPAVADEIVDDIFVHVVAHEIGHAVLREFDLPLLASEEDMADAFAVVLLADRLPEDATRILTHRVAAHWVENDTPGPFSEYQSDRRRAGQMVCLHHGMVPDARAPELNALGLTEREAAACRDRGPEIGRGWRRLLAPLRLPDGVRATETTLQRGEGLSADGTPSPQAVALAMDLLAAFDWHSQITLALDDCDGSAQWSRNGRIILICDAYLARLATAAREFGG